MDSEISRQKRTRSVLSDDDAPASPSPAPRVRPPPESSAAVPLPQALLNNVIELAVKLESIHDDLQHWGMTEIRNKKLSNSGFEKFSEHISILLSTIKQVKASAQVACASQDAETSLAATLKREFKRMESILSTKAIPVAPRPAPPPPRRTAPPPTSAPVRSGPVRSEPPAEATWATVVSRQGRRRAAATALPQRPETPQQVPKDKVIVIKPSATPQDCTQQQASAITKQAVKACLDPKKLRLPIKSIRDGRDGSVLVTLAPNTDVSPLSQSAVLQAQGYQVSERSLLKPRVFLYDVPSEFSASDLPEVVFVQNFEDSPITQAEFTAGFRPVFKTGRRESDTGHWVVECSPKIRQALLDRQHICTGYSASRVRDHIDISRCFKCQRHGHVTKTCRQTQDTCGHCAQVGHDRKVCPSLNSPAVCANCKRQGYASNHPVNSGSCSSFLHTIKQSAARTDYGC